MIWSRTEELPVIPPLLTYDVFAALDLPNNLSRTTIQMGSDVLTHPATLMITMINCWASSVIFKNSAFLCVLLI